MKTIPAEKIDEICAEVMEANEVQSQSMARRMQEEQPFVMVYLLGADEEVYDDSERGRLLELGVIIWRAMSSGHRRLRTVTEVQLQEAEAANLQMLTKADEGSEMDFEEMLDRLLTTYNQMPLLGAMLEGLMAGYEDDPELSPQEQGLAWIYLKTVIDCLDQ